METPLLAGPFHGGVAVVRLTASTCPKWAILYVNRGQRSWCLIEIELTRLRYLRFRAELNASEIPGRPGANLVSAGV